MSSLSIAVLNGPNLNLLGSREPETYGTETLSDISAALDTLADDLGAKLVHRQSNQEGDLVDWLQDAGRSADGVLLNAAAFTHTSVAIRDAVAAISVPVIELHMSNVFAREDFRHHSYISPVAAGVICGFGSTSYSLALRAIVSMVRT